jgi:hypothetical protein
VAKQFANTFIITVTKISERYDLSFRNNFKIKFCNVQRITDSKDEALRPTHIQQYLLYQWPLKGLLQGTVATHLRPESVRVKNYFQNEVCFPATGRDITPPPASPRKRRKEYPVPGSKTGSPCPWGT